ncbi:hypothetical protein Dvina_42950 [Dactylosporangium vinaceum]|uniref:Uncharacterized protein n=1 Tax=Dactylosporangium vinaceum TaxID=53362 RepID=A0ABV5MHC9_9ACTN|nr:hypothetical protein [Dactylosporangium vinaceum]UAB94795.1 hypothetical protein Dvina_42950 [Dactylosporangium vinaceum]
MTDDDVTRDGLPRFIYGEYTGEIKLPPRPEDDDVPGGPMDRNTKFLVAGGGLALLLIIGIVVAALSTTASTPDTTPAAANPETSAVSSSGTPVPTDDPQVTATQSWPQLTNTEIPGGQATTTKPGSTPTTKPGATNTVKPPATQTTKPGPFPTTKKPRPSFPGNQ